MLNCLVVDDEPLARSQIESYIARTSFLAHGGSVRNIAGAKTILDTQAIDLLFLDIKMPGLTGIEFLKTSLIFQQVIFVTAFPEFALDGFELEVTDFLMKPVTYERFLKATEKAITKVNGSQTIKKIQNQPGFIYVKHNQRYEKVMIVDILFIESMLNYVNIITSNKKYTVYSSLKNIESLLPPGTFFKIHKSYLASLLHITAIEDNQVYIGHFSIPVSRGNKQEILKLLNLK